MGHVALRYRVGTTAAKKHETHTRHKLISKGKLFEDYIVPLVRKTHLRACTAQSVSSRQNPFVQVETPCDLSRGNKARKA